MKPRALHGALEACGYLLGATVVAVAVFTHPGLVPAGLAALLVTAFVCDVRADGGTAEQDNIHVQREIAQLTDENLTRAMRRWAGGR